MFGVTRRLLFSWIVWQLASPLAAQTIDFTHAHALEGIPGVERGYCQYHLKADEYGRSHFVETLYKIPRGSTIAFDWEPWTKRQQDYPWYGDATEEQNLEMMSRYAWLIREVTPVLKERELTLAIYSVPTLMPRNWSRIRFKDHSTNHQLYEDWLADQVRVIEQAEQSGLLPSLRDCGGYVQVVGYLPKAFDGDLPVHVRAVGKTIDNMEEVLKKYDVPYRWLWRPCHPAFMKVMIDKTYGQSDWWEDGNPTEEFDSLRSLLGKAAADSSS